MNNLKATLLKSRTLTYEIEIDEEAARHCAAKMHHIQAFTGVVCVSFNNDGNLIVEIINCRHSDTLLNGVLSIIENIKEK